MHVKRHRFRNLAGPKEQGLLDLGLLAKRRTLAKQAKLALINICPEPSSH
jgi:hypothetical protein